MTKKVNSVYLKQMLDHLDDLASYIKGFTVAKFGKDKKTQSAVILKLMVVGELSKKLSEQVKKKINQPWKDIAGFRDVAIHNYEDLDLSIVWDAATNYAPNLRRAIRKYLKST